MKDLTNITGKLFHSISWPSIQKILRYFSLDQSPGPHQVTFTASCKAFLAWLFSQMLALGLGALKESNIMKSESSVFVLRHPRSSHNVKVKLLVEITKLESCVARMTNPHDQLLCVCGT